MDTPKKSSYSQAKMGKWAHRAFKENAASLVLVVAMAEMAVKDCRETMVRTEFLDSVLKRL
jgi:hypothetical protein